LNTEEDEYGNIKLSDKLPPPPDGFDEHLLVGRKFWHGFFTTMPQDLIAEDTDDAVFQKMEDNQVGLLDTFDVIDRNFDDIESMVKKLLA